MIKEEKSVMFQKRIIQNWMLDYISSLKCTDSNARILRSIPIPKKADSFEHYYDESLAIRLHLWCLKDIIQRTDFEKFDLALEMMSIFNQNVGAFHVMQKIALYTISNILRGDIMKVGGGNNLALRIDLEKFKLTHGRMSDLFVKCGLQLNLGIDVLTGEDICNATEKYIIWYPPSNFLERYFKIPPLDKIRNERCEPDHLYAHLLHNDERIMCVKHVIQSTSSEDSSTGIIRWIDNMSAKLPVSKLKHIYLRFSGSKDETIPVTSMPSSSCHSSNNVSTDSLTCAMSNSLNQSCLSPVVYVQKNTNHIDSLSLASDKVSAQKHLQFADENSLRKASVINSDTTNLIEKTPEPDTKTTVPSTEDLSADGNICKTNALAHDTTTVKETKKINPKCGKKESKVGRKYKKRSRTKNDRSSDNVLSMQSNSQNFDADSSPTKFVAHKIIQDEPKTKKHKRQTSVNSTENHEEKAANSTDENVNEIEVSLGNGGLVVAEDADESGIPTYFLD